MAALTVHTFCPKQMLPPSQQRDQPNSQTFPGVFFFFFSAWHAHIQWKKKARLCTTDQVGHASPTENLSKLSLLLEGSLQCQTGRKLLLVAHVQRCFCKMCQGFGISASYRVRLQLGFNTTLLAAAIVAEISQASIHVVTVALYLRIPGSCCW